MVLRCSASVASSAALLVAGCTALFPFAADDAAPDAHETGVDGGDASGEPIVFVPSNVASGFQLDGPDVTVHNPVTFDTNACTDDLGPTEIVTQDHGPGLCVIRPRTLTVASTVSTSGARALVILAAGAVRIDGTLDLSARGNASGPGGYPGGTALWGFGVAQDERRDGFGAASTAGRHGEHSAAGADGKTGTEDDHIDGGGGGGALCGAGGAGGTPIAEAAGGAGGTPYLVVDEAWPLVPLVGGGGGGAGHGAWQPGAAGRGGGGGGALQISSLEAISVSGSILAGGGGGGGGCDMMVDEQERPLDPAGFCAGGGGGGGGAVLLEAPAIEISGRIVATGGGGGSSGSGGNDSAAVGNPGQDGADADLARASGGRAVGGRSREGATSGGRSTLAGANGLAAETAEGSGGGGGAGCVLLRTSDGTFTGDANVSISPVVEPGLRVYWLEAITR